MARQLIVLLLAVFHISVLSAQDFSAVQNRLKEHIYFLASDSLEGRMTGSNGEEIAAAYISSLFKEAGVVPKGGDNYFQTFEFSLGKEYGSNNLFSFDDQQLNVDEDFYPLPFSANISIEAPVQYVNYGILATDLNYNNFENIKNLNGKIFIIELSSPDGIHPHSKYKEYSSIEQKIKNALLKGAVGIIFINNDPHLPDPVLNMQTNSDAANIPIIFVRNRDLYPILKQAKAAVITVDIKPDTIKARNVIGYIDNNAKHTVIIGAHYDHLGYGKQNSLYTGKPAIHNGADDNASGVAVMLELASYLNNSHFSNNNYLFIAFSGEELGLYGSNYFTDNPTIDLEMTNYMINLDMVGRLDSFDKHLAINGFGTSPRWEVAFNNINNKNFSIQTSKSAIGPSDHTSFYLSDIPVLHFFTGTHEDYHKPSDDAWKINYAGTTDIYALIIELIAELNDEDKIVFSKTKEENSRKAPKFSVTLGVVPDYMFDGEGMKIEGVSAGKPAEKAGIKKDDIVIQMGNYNVTDMMSYMQALSEFKTGETTMVKVRRGKIIKGLKVTFE